MPEHSLFYYPYGSFTNADVPLMKVAAFYFDSLSILDPLNASWDTIGPPPSISEEISLLGEAGILRTISPSDVLAKYADSIMDGIRADIHDRAFLDLCEQRGGRWTLSLAKVPQDPSAEFEMRWLLGRFAREISAEAASAVYDYQEHRNAIGAIGTDVYEPFRSRQTNQLLNYSSSGEVYDEYRDTREYRYADFPLAVGEAIMLNHALLAGVLYAGATPITDDPFHSRALEIKLRRAVQDPSIRRILDDRARVRHMKVDSLAATALRDSQLNLPVLNTKLPLTEVLEYRGKHEAELIAVREKLGWMARRIESEPWTNDFANHLEYQTIPEIRKLLDEATKARDGWLASARGRRALIAAGIVAGAAAAVLTVIAAPISAVALAAGGASLVAGAGIPGAQLVLDWGHDDNRTLKENGLHYLLMMK